MGKLRVDKGGVSKRLTTLLTILLLLSGCSEPVHQNTIEMRDLTESMAEREQTKLEYIRENAKPDFERHYGEGRYEKDFSELNSQASEIFKNGIIEDLKQIQEGEYFVIGDVEFFNDSLEKVENGELSLEELPANTLDHAKECELIVYVFVEGVLGEHVSDRVNYLREVADEFTRGIVRNPSIIIKTFDASILSKITLEELNSDDQRDLYLMSSDVEKEILHFDDTFSWWDTSSIPMNPIEDLEEKYNEEFIVLNPLKKVNSGYMVCAPKRDVTLSFEDGSGILEGDRYLNVLAQNMLNDEIEAILESHGAEDLIIQYNSINFDGKGSMDTSSIKSIRDIVDSSNSIDIRTTLYYLLMPDESIDSKLLFDISQDIHRLTEGLEPIRNVTWVRIFEMDHTNRDVAIDLLRRKEITSDYMRERQTFLKLETLDENDADSDAFNYLYTYGNEYNYKLHLFDMLNKTYRKDFLDEYRSGGQGN